MKLLIAIALVLFSAMVSAGKETDAKVDALDSRMQRIERVIDNQALLPGEKQRGGRAGCFENEQAGPLNIRSRPAVFHSKRAGCILPRLPDGPTLAGSINLVVASSAEGSLMSLRRRNRRE